MSSDQADKMQVPYPQYLCPTCGKELPLSDARLTVNCAQHTPSPEPLDFVVRDAAPADRRAIEEICDRAWGETEIDVFGSTFDVMASENVIADVSEELAGLISLAVDGGQLAIVMFSVYPQYQGRRVGSALVEAAVERAADKNLRSLKAAVSNDDIPMLYFYQRHEFEIYEVAPGVLADRLGYAGAGFSEIPMRDEIRLRRPVCA